MYRTNLRNYTTSPSWPSSRGFLLKTRMTMCTKKNHSISMCTSGPSWGQHHSHACLSGTLHSLPIPRPFSPHLIQASPSSLLLTMHSQRKSHYLPTRTSDPGFLPDINRPSLACKLKRTDTTLIPDLTYTPHCLQNAMFMLYSPS